ncbi:P-loop ATPase, Sll1717 family, partial [Acetobacter cerevisiae]
GITTTGYSLSSPQNCPNGRDHLNITVWIAFDRLDEAFAGYADTELPALRALLRTYLDLLEFNKIKIKLFVRRDLFSRITAGGFVNLTHIHARKLEISWREPDLLNLLSRRIRENNAFCKVFGLEELNDRDIFDALFPPQVDFGTRKPGTWVWMMRRIRDGNDVKSPRNLIDLIQLSQDAQLKREDIEERPIGSRPIFEPGALRNGLADLSVRRVTDTLFAEAGTAVQAIEKFRGGKAEHNLASICDLLGLTPGEAKIQIRALTVIGFLEEIKDNFKVPSLYREGMKITQGKALGVAAVDSDDDE